MTERSPAPATVVELKTLTLEEQLGTLRARMADDWPERLDAVDANHATAPHAPSVLVASREVLPIAQAALRVERRGRPVVLGHLQPEELNRFVPIPVVELPDRPAYLAIGVDLGASTRNVPPEDALKEILAAGRSPLTLDEGVALMLQQPEVIARNWGFSTAGSRCGDQRVPAFWVSDGRPKLGWCWDRNPHSWLGTASCAHRVAVS